MNSTTIPTLCGSVAAKPSPLGVALHNSGYEALGLSFRYVAIGADTLEPIVEAIRQLNFRGIGVSMPFKQEVIAFLDHVSDDVRVIGACNTVVQDNGKLTGYNTDWIGALAALDEAHPPSLSSAVIVGSGGVARAIAYGLKRRGLKVFISARSVDDRKTLTSELHLDGHGELSEQGQYGAELIVNATPVADIENCPVDLKTHRESRVLLDVVFQKRQTPLVQAAKNQGLLVIPGWRMLLQQALRQFKLYTGVEPPVEVMSRVLERALPEK